MSHLRILQEVITIEFKISTRMSHNSGMRAEHQERIRKNFKDLVNLCNIDRVMSKLAREQVFSADTVDSMQNLNGSEKARTLFIDIQKRGPNAFKHLINALVKTNHERLALLLDPKKDFFPEQREKTSRTGAEPFLLPNYNDNEIQQFHERYPTYNISMTEEPLKVEVQDSVNFEQDEPSNNRSPVYYTRSKKRGMVKIINIFDVKGHKSRRGSEKDVLSLKDLFEQMGMTVDTSTNLTSEEIEQQIRIFVKNDELKNADIAILVIMSHGGLTEKKQEEFFMDKYAQPVLTSFVESQFTNEVCTHMQGKPKIIIYQTCRGKINDFGVEHSVEEDGVPMLKMPTISDILIVNSTLKEYKAHRDIYVGAWFIQLLCKVFMERAHNTHVEDMLKLIQYSLHQQRSMENTMQTAEYINRSFKLCYLNPGVFMENGNLCHY